MDDRDFKDFFTRFSVRKVMRGVQDQVSCFIKFIINKFEELSNK